MSTTRDALGRIASFAGAISIGLGGGGCLEDVAVPACPVQCFQYTVEYVAQKTCTNGMGGVFTISFTGHDPDGYFGRYCDNSVNAELATSAINHLRSGGELSDLGMDVAAAYFSVVEAVEDDIVAACTAAAPGQCVDETTTCSGIKGDMHAQLVTEQTCILEPGVVEHIETEVCAFTPAIFATGPAEPGAFCTDTGGTDGADETTGEMAGPPFGDIEELVSCDPQTECEVDRELIFDISANFEVFATEEVTLTMVDGGVQCGPGAKVGGLNSGEDSASLAAAFDFRNGDIIQEVESITLDDLDDAMEAVSSLLEDPSTTIVLRRANGSSCTTLTYEIDVL